jgi:DNA-directed RNA polymerase subunit RPC12/RpoP
VTRSEDVTLVCKECGREWRTDERGWRAYLTTDEDEPAEAIVYCPECAIREFESG